MTRNAIRALMTCAMLLVAASVAAKTPTFSREVVRIFQQHCQACHRSGDIAPFPLVTYADAKEHARMIRTAVAMRKMPPWMPAEGCRAIKGERRLTKQEIETITRWVDAGAPEGKRRHLPPPRVFSSGWELGKPDHVFRMPEPYTPAVGRDTYRCFSIPTGLDAKTYVRAFDTHPGDRTRVHHVAAYLDPGGASEALDAADPEPGYSCFGGPGFANPSLFAGWGPGTRATQLPPQVAIEIPAGARVVLQVHYHGHSQHGQHAQPDQTEMGVYLAKAPPAQLMRFEVVVNTSFVIPPETPSYEVTATSQPARSTGRIWYVAPHMHLLGRSIRMEATLPDGTKRCLIDVPDWQFNWQGGYLFEQPVEIPAGTRLSLKAVYANPTERAVSWGEQTTDEMAVGVFGITWDE